MIKKIRRRVVGDKDVHQTIVVKIATNHAQTVVAVGISDAGLAGNISESAVAIVVIERVARAFQSSGSALYTALL